MSIESKHAYRFVFLKSEEWSNQRIARLARDGAKCRICRIRNLSNDVHHAKYPKNWKSTDLVHLKTLCRECHDDVHEMMKNHPNWTWREIKGPLQRIGMLVPVASCIAQGRLLRKIIC